MKDMREEDGKCREEGPNCLKSDTGARAEKQKIEGADRGRQLKITLF